MHQRFLCGGKLPRKSTRQFSGRKGCRGWYSTPSTERAMFSMLRKEEGVFTSDRTYSFYLLVIGVSFNIFATSYRESHVEIVIKPKQRVQRYTNLLRVTPLYSIGI
jgi:hypothetical protein